LPERLEPTTDSEVQTGKNRVATSMIPAIPFQEAEIREKGQEKSDS